MKAKSIKVIFDTNVWVSYLIGKQLSGISKYIWNKEILIIVCEQLLLEIKEVTTREKLKKYFPPDSVKNLLNLLGEIALNVPITPTHFINRDLKDNFLLDLIDFSKADYLITGDKDLLIMKSFKTAKILSPENFERALEKTKLF